MFKTQLFVITEIDEQGKYKIRVENLGFISITLQAMEQKRFGMSCRYLPQTSQAEPNFAFVDGLASLDIGRGFRCTALSPLIL